jgi:STE24 endopeptidase
MYRPAGMLLGIWLLLVSSGMMATLQNGNSPSSAPQPTQPEQLTVQAQAAQPPLSYTLSPERRAKAVSYARSRYLLFFLGTLNSLCIYLLLWRTGVTVSFRNWARRISSRHFIQLLIFVPLFAATASVLNLPIEYYSGYVLEHRFGLSTQSLASWFGDWGKSMVILSALGTFVAWIFYAVVSRSPRRWWFYFWVASIPLVLALILIEPYVIDPLFDKFTPLEKTQPALVERIEAMMDHAGLSVPISRIFEMDASTRTRKINAYVSGLGSSKRIVVWDTTLNKMGSDEVLLVLGHETGHYVLYHIPKEFALDESVVLLFFILGFFAVNRLVRWGGRHSAIEGVGDLASLPILLIVLTALTLAADPLVNGISRYYEHQADQFALEVAYGIVPDPNAAEIRALQILGEEDLADPAPNPLIKFWLYTHPPLDDRIHFASTYKPWAEGKHLNLLPAR